MRKMAKHIKNGHLHQAKIRLLVTSLSTNMVTSYLGVIQSWRREKADVATNKMNASSFRVVIISTIIFHEPRILIIPQLWKAPFRKNHISQWHSIINLFISQSGGARNSRGWKDEELLLWSLGLQRHSRGHQGADGRRGRIREQLDVRVRGALQRKMTGGMFPKKSRRWPKRALMIRVGEIAFLTGNFSDSGNMRYISSWRCWKRILIFFGIQRHVGKGIGFFFWDPKARHFEVQVISKCSWSCGTTKVVDQRGPTSKREWSSAAKWWWWCYVALQFRCNQL